MPHMHYMLPPADRLVGASLDRYVREQLYWVLHAPRQTGKTTFLQSWMREINAGDEAIACYVSVERCQQMPALAEAMPAGLVAIGADGSPGIANAIYREVLARELSFGMQMAIPPPEFQWRTDEGTLDMDALMAEFQTFWAWHSETWEEKADYTEAFPHLLLMAFLQRIVNGGGSIDREYAAGRGRVDLLVTWGGRRHLVEIKLVHPKMGRDMTLARGLQQIDRYADRTKPDTLHLVIFDRRDEARAKPWEERLGTEKSTTPGGRAVAVVWA